MQWFDFKALHSFYTLKISENQIFTNCRSLKRKRKKFTNDESEVFESQYEQHYQNNEEIKKTKYLLPIKTSEGIVVRSEEILSEDEKENYSTKKKSEFQFL